MNDVVVSKGPAYASVPMQSDQGGGSLVPQTLGDVVAFAKIMAGADLALPKHLRRNEGACMAVAMQAFRWQMDPFAVANKTYSVNDRLAYEAQLVSAVVNMRAPILSSPTYSYRGEGPTRQCLVSCVMRDGEVREYETPEVGKIKVKNSPLWQSDQDQQLAYYAIRSWARRYAPEVILGVYDREELIEAEASNPKPGERSVFGQRLAERARQAQDEGFNAVNKTEPESAVNEAVVIDAETQGDAQEPIVEETDIPEPEDTPEPPETTYGGFTAAELISWGTGAIAVAESFKTKAKLQSFWEDEETKRRYVLLKEVDPDISRQLHTIVLQRSREFG